MQIIDGSIKLDVNCQGNIENDNTKDTAKSDIKINHTIKSILRIHKQTRKLFYSRLSYYIHRYNAIHFVDALFRYTSVTN